MKASPAPVYTITKLIPLDSEVYTKKEDVRYVFCYECGKNTKYGEHRCCCWCGANILANLPYYDVFLTEDDKQKFAASYCPNCKKVVWNPTSFCTECGSHIAWNIKE